MKKTIRDTVIGFVKDKCSKVNEVLSVGVSSEEFIVECEIKDNTGTCTRTYTNTCTIDRELVNPRLKWKFPLLP